MPVDSSRPLGGRTILITGAGTRQGRHHAVTFGRAGANLVLSESAGEVWPDGADDRLSATIDEVESTGCQVVGSTDDVSDWNGAKAVIELAIERFGGVHGLFNNAGNTADRTIAKMTHAEWRASIATCLDAAFFPLHFAMEHWRTLDDPKSQHLRVLNRTSSSSILAQPGQANYVAAMDAVVALTRVAAREGQALGLNVNAICGPLDEPALLAITASRGKNRPSPEETAARDPRLDGRHLSPFAAYLLSAACDVSGKVFLTQYQRLRIYEPWHQVAESDFDGAWDIEHMASYVHRLPG